MRAAIVERRFWPTMLELRTCLCDELAKSAPNEPLCSCAVLPGLPDTSTIPAGKGAAWVRQITTSAVQATTNVEASPCGSMWEAVIEIGVLRCAPVQQGRATSITDEQWEATTELVLSDQAAMLRALCCVKVHRASWSAGTYTPLGPEGGLVGGAWTFVLQEQ